MRHLKMWHRAAWGVVLLLSIGIASTPDWGFYSSAETPGPDVERDNLSDWQAVGQVGGPTQAVAVQDSYAYVGVGLQLVVLDVSNPATPTEVGSTTPFSYFVEDIVISDTLAYVASGGAGLHVVNVSDPAYPVEIGAWDSPGYAEGVAVSGTTVYLADGPYGLWTVDVSNPAHPVPVGSAYDMSYAFEVAVAGQYAYIAGAGAGLLVADVSDPAHPMEAGVLDTPGYAYGVAVSGSTVYVADAWEGLQAVNVSDPGDPVVLGAGDTPGWALNVAVDGTTAYVADGAGGLRVIDVADPAHPIEVGDYEDPTLARRLAVADEVVYLADLHDGLLVVNVTDPTSPAQIGLDEPLVEARRVTAAGSYAYVAAGFSGLRVVDVSDPAHPIEVAARDTEGGYATAVILDGTTLYLAAFYQGPTSLYILDVSDPVSPTLVGTIPQGDGTFRDIALLGNTLHVADEWGLRIFDLSDPQTPVEIGFIRLNQNLQETSSVAVSGTLAYLADAGDGVKIVDVSDPYSPTLVSVYDTLFACGVAVVDDILYVADHGWGLHVVDVSDPYDPVELGRYDTPGIAESVVISGTTAYVSDSGGGVSVIDVSNPFTPALIAHLETPGLAYHTALDGDKAYVADGRGGLLIFEPAADGMDAILGGIPAGEDLPAPTISTDPVPATPEALKLDSTCVVTSTADSGAGTLRQCLESATSGTTVTFDLLVFPPTSPATITLNIPLPSLNQGYVTLDGSDAGVVIDGSGLPPGASGLVITSDHNTVQGLQILSFPSMGVSIGGGACYNLIGGDRTQGNGPVGQGNLLSGHGNAGIGIGGTGTMSNTVVGNLIGTDLTGTAVLTNGNGVSIGDGARYNVVGAIAPGERNVIGGSLDNDITLWGSGTERNVVQYNLIGTDLSGQFSLRPTPLPGGWTSGVHLHSGAHHNQIGPGNVINGNTWGVLLNSAGTTDNVITGNLIGTNAGGTAGIGNFHQGVSLNPGVQRNRVGPDNRIAYNGGGGVTVNGTTALSNTITANAIYANVGLGIGISDGGNGDPAPPVISQATVTTVVGIASPGAVVEVFSDQEDEGGIYEGATIATVSGAFTFTQAGGLAGPHLTATATDPDGNTSEFSSSVILWTATHIVTSSLDSGPGTLRQMLLDARMGDTITFDPAVFPPTSPATIALLSALPPVTQGGLTIDGSDAGVIVDGNLLGEANGLTIASDHNRVQGLQVLHFAQCGVHVGGNYNVIGGDRTQGAGPAGQGNVISENWFGLCVSGDENTIIGNLVGTDASGTLARGNHHGIGLGGTGNTVGGTTPGLRNIVSANLDKGIEMLGNLSSGNRIIGNYVGTDISGTYALGNHRTGISIEDGPWGNIVGGTGLGEGNLISGNGTGVVISGSDAAHNAVLGNFIGTDATGTVAIPNAVGISLCGSGYDRVGGPEEGARNLISGNTNSAIAVCNWGIPHTLVLGNIIGADVTATQPLGNGNGFHLLGQNAHIVQNVISGNRGPGVDAEGAGTEYNWISQNAIGTDAGGSVSISNGGAGVMLKNFSAYGFVQGNTIAFNDEQGVWVSESRFNTLRRNAIYGHTAEGILLADGGNEMLPAPVVLTVTQAAVAGTACPACIVEVFSDEADEGRVYEGYTIADANGDWMWAGDLEGPCVTATVTDQTGNTSAFADPRMALWHRIYLPMVLRAEK